MGGIPFLIPYDLGAIETYLDTIDGLILSGSDSDIDPTLYGESPKSFTTAPNLQRTRFEMALLRAALQRGMPILGTCGGAQLLNVMYGGTLIQDIPTEVPHALNHYPRKDAGEKTHIVHTVSGTLLSKLVGEKAFWTNSFHHQAAKRVKVPLRVNARTADGIIEGIEDPTKPFVLGVQFHPEFFGTLQDRKIIKGFVEAAQSYRTQHRDSLFKE